jgi:actin related protein 2/3 complex subunit 2
MNIKCWNELARYGANSVLEREYGSLLQKQPEPDYNVTLEIDLDQVPPEGGMYFPVYICSLYDTYQ